jgi:C1A family cysteine protease
MEDFSNEDNVSTLYKLNYVYCDKDARDYIYKPPSIEETNKNRLTIIKHFHKANQQIIKKYKKINRPIRDRVKLNKQIINSQINSLNKQLALPVQVSLQNKIKYILDQGYIGSCVANVFSQYILMTNNNTTFISRLYFYYCCRLLSKLPNTEDTGLNIRDACKTINKVGYCNEQSWIYNVSNFDVMPPLRCFQAPVCKIPPQYSYFFITGANSDKLLYNLKNVFISGKPIIFGISVYSSLLSNNVSKTGIVPLPDKTKETFEGGHCVLGIGYDDTKNYIICVNSWGKNWGNGGLFYLPYNYVTDNDLAGDFCVVNIKI